MVPDSESARDDELIAQAVRQVERLRRSMPVHTGGSSGRSERGAPSGTLPFVGSDAIPGYQIIGELQRGGQGVVYEALQRGTRRQVAIKVLHERQLGGASRGRFEREIEILAQLRHPNIVTIHDSAQSGGLLFYVMDLIDGDRFDEFAAEHRDADADQVLVTFAKVCDAVQTAHLRGVMHRDLKPSNILVDAAGEPHVLDFGLAKWLDSGDLTAATDMTAAGQFIGSLLWASPEQVAGAHTRLDLRCDVYSLGVILCHALTGRLPYPTPATLEEAARHIRESEPLRPTGLRADLDNELDTIVLKCLQKDPQRRYQTAGELGRDVRRYLADEPIEAKRDSLVYVLRKRLRRHRSIAFAGTATAFVALLGLAVVVYFWHQSDAQRRRADQRFAEVRSLAHAAFFDVHDRIVDVPGTLPARKFLVETAIDYLDRLAAESEDNPELLRELANGYVRVGTMQGNPSRSNLGETEAALRSYARAQSIYRALLGDDPENADLRRELASLLLYTGNVQTVRNDHQAARDAYEQCRAEADAVYAATRTPADLRGVANARGAVAEMLAVEGRGDEALVEYRKALSMLAAIDGDAPLTALVQRDRCRTQRCIGDLLFDRRDFAAARDCFEESLRLAEERLSHHSDSVDAHSLAAVAAARVGDALTQLTNDDSPLAYLSRAVDLAKATADAEPADAQAQSDLAGMMRSVLDFHLYRWEAATDISVRRGHLAAAIEWAERTRDFWAELERTGVILPIDAATPAEYVQFVEMLKRLQEELNSSVDDGSDTESPPVILPRRRCHAFSAF